MEITLARLKQEYSALETRFGLPGFEKMNEEFDIEKLQEKETDFLIREIRRAMLEKNVAYLRFLELVLNPSSSPMFVLVLLNNLTGTERKALNDLYLELGRYELSSMALDNNYDEAKEIEFIKSFFGKWVDIKKRFSEIMAVFENSWNTQSVKKEKGYLG